MEEVKKYGNVSVIIDDSLVEDDNVDFLIRQMQSIRSRSIADGKKGKNATH